MVIVDLLMPGLDGFEFIRRYRQTPAGRRALVVVWTHKDVNEQDRKVPHASVQAVVQKESGAKTLLEELHHYLVPPRELEALNAFSRRGAPAKEPSAVLEETREKS